LEEGAFFWGFDDAVLATRQPFRLPLERQTPNVAKQASPAGGQPWQAIPKM
jgi:hypothetical protein